MIVAVVPTDELERLRQIERLAGVAMGYVDLETSAGARLELRRLLGLIGQKEVDEVKAWLKRK